MDKRVNRYRKSGPPGLELCLTQTRSSGPMVETAPGALGQAKDLR